MASIHRTDIMQKKYSKSRPAKSEGDTIYKRKEAYKWRDLRRVFLASSFDRWRKLRSSLKLTDSSLAWHLMEAHEKGQCTLCRNCHQQSTRKGGKRRRKCDQKEFLPTLIATVRQLCYTHFDFNECIEIVGLLCLEFDKARKENFSINECVQSSGCHVSNSTAELPNGSIQGTDAKSSLSVSPADYQDIHKFNMSELETQTVVASTPCSAASTDSTLSTDIGLSETQNEQLHSIQDLHTLCATSSKPRVLQENVSTDTHPLTCTLLRNGVSKDSTCMQASPKAEAHHHHPEHLESTVVTLQPKLSEEKLVDSSMCSESEPSLEIDIENMDTSQEEDSTSLNSKRTGHLLSDPNLKPDTCYGDSSLPFIGNNLKNQQSADNYTLRSSEVSKVVSSEYVCEMADKDDPAARGQVRPDNVDLPLDMSVLKPIVKKEPDAGLPTNSVHDYRSDTSSPNYRDNEGAHLELFSSLPSTAKRKIQETTSVSPQSSRRSPFWLEGLQTLPGKMKEDGHVSIPWQRRDMSRKEEYEFLEMNPFSDLADFSQRYPHVHQRTYYRWKRRIKEEYIILEQCPSMTFQDFSSVVLQAKESVFLHWKSLIAQGKGFFAPSDTKRLEAKPCLKPSSHHNSAFAFMQKNLTCTYEQFCQQYPGTPVDVFNVLKRKAMQDFWLFHQNKHLSHKDFSKIVNVTEDVFNTWKEYIDGFRANTSSSNVKAVSNNLSQNQSLSVPSIYSLDGSHSLTSDLQLQSSKDGNYRVKDGCTVSNESKVATQSGSLSSPLSDSVVRSLSTSYLASLQNMMFPWHNYYGMASPLSQQMLPMMLWPGMMGLAGGITNSIGLMSSLHANGFPKPSSDTELHTSLLESHESIRSDESQSSQSDEYTHSSKILRSSENREQSRKLDSSDSEKRLKLSNDRDDGDVSGSASRSRKQNKQEYVYYLKNPELCFKELESLFPTISLRTFYRWRKEMNAAVLLLEDNKDLPFCQFQLIFPDIPEDIFELWKEKIGRGLSPTSEKHNQQSLESGEIYHPKQSSSVSGKNSAELSKLVESKTAELISNNFSNNSVAGGIHLNGKEDGARLFKKVKEGYHYVQKNPDVDIASFTKLYPDTSVRSFYRWKKELKNALAFLRANPAMAYTEYKSVDSTITEEVFRIWKSLALDSNVIKEEVVEDSASAGVSQTGISNHKIKFISPEYWFLQLNPYIEYSQFNCTYPDISEHTFYRWKQEIHQIMNYIRTEPSVVLADIAAMLPQVSEDAFSRWKQIIALERENSVDDKRASTEESKEPGHRLEIKNESGNQMNDALIYLMHNPTVDYGDFKVKFDFVSATVFEQWFTRIKIIISWMVSNPGNKYTAFRTKFNDISEDIFERWKNLSSDEIAALNMDSEPNSANDPELGSISDEQDEDLSLGAFEFCQKNPAVTFTSFQTLYPTVSEKVFHDWKTRIQEELQYIQTHPYLTFDDHAKVYTDTSKDIFNLWKSEGTCQFLPNSSEKVDQTGGGPLENSCEENLNEDMPSDEHIDPEIMNQNVEDEMFREFGNGETLKEHQVYSHCISESLDNEPNESSLSKLAKFADSGAAAAYPRQYVTRELTPFEHLLGNNNNTSLKLEPGLSPSEDDCLPSAEMSLPALQLHSTQTPGAGAEVGDVYTSSPLSSALHTSSLSALMALSRSEDAHHSGSPSSTQKEPMGHSAQFVCPGNRNWQGAPNGSGNFTSAGVSKEDDEAFSSQRQKKMSRAEYLFVKDNPDVDSQEFSRIFPGVSARTFYRWKREIKTQLHLA